MIEAGDQIIMSKKERDEYLQTFAQKILEGAKDMLLTEKPVKSTLNIKGVMVLLKKSRAYVDNARRRKNNPLPMVGDPPLIEEDVAWNWYVEHSGDYQH